MEIYRQGDLLIKSIDEIPSKAKLRDTTIILYGEVTGHKHQLKNGKVYDHENLIYLNVPSKSLIVHEEHKPISLKRGKYVVIRQREYLSSDMVRLVID